MEPHVLSLRRVVSDLKKAFPGLFLLARFLEGKTLRTELGCTKTVEGQGEEETTCMEDGQGEVIQIAKWL